MSVAFGTQKRQFGVVGHPVGQSLSPALHNFGFAQHALACEYHAYDRRPDELAAFIQTVRDRPLHGISVTIPHKEAVMALVDGVSEAARAVGAVNTLHWDEGQLIGHNTDLEGFLAPLGRYEPSNALVFGSGGAARAVVAGLCQRGSTTVYVTARTQNQARRLAETFGAVPVAWEERTEVLTSLRPELVVNTTPLGMFGTFVNDSPLPSSAWPAVHGKRAVSLGDTMAESERVLPTDKDQYLAYDIVYRPRVTRFLRDAAARGWRIQGGLDFFVAQGCLQFSLWTGVDLDRAAVQGSLAQRLHPE